MIRENRTEQFETRLAEYMAEHGKNRPSVLWAVMKEFGYTTAENERQIYFVYATDQKEKLAAVKEAKVEIVGEDEESDTKFEAALSALDKEYAGILPPDLLWMYTHPALSRQNRQRTNKKIMLTAEDLKHTVTTADGHVIRPNTGMVSMLQHYCNSPKEFFHQILDRMKKEKIAVEEASKEENFDSPRSLAAISRMIKQAANAKVK